MNEILCCDYRELLGGLPRESVSVVITDPPFGISYQNNFTHKVHGVLKGDESEFSYAELGREAFRVMKQDTPLFAFTGWSEYPAHFQQISACGFAMKEPIICQKRPSGKTDLYGTFQTNADWVVFAHKGHFCFRQTKLLRNKRAGTIPNKGRRPVAEFKTRLPSCWFGDEYPWSSENPTFQKKRDFQHPTIKSQEFIEWLILISTEVGDVVLDPFVGSGTVAAAAKKLGRNYIACDISPEFCEMARRRLQEASP